jgi:hypothetical protein
MNEDPEESDGKEWFNIDDRHDPSVACAEVTDEAIFWKIPR